MTNLIKRIALAGAIGLASLLPMQRAEAQTQVSVNSTMKNHYVAVPGFMMEKEPVVQSSVTVSRNGLYGLLWTNHNLKNRAISEVDYTVGYGRNVSGIDVDASYNFFDLRNNGETKANDNIEEFWLTFSKKGKVTPKIFFEQNLSAGTFENSRGLNVLASLSHSRDIVGVPISVEGSVQYNDKYFTPNRRFSIAQIDVSLPLVIKGISVTPQFKGRKALDKINFKNTSDVCLSVGYNFGGKK